MKRTLILGLSIVMALPVLVTTGVFAQGTVKPKTAQAQTEVPKTPEEIKALTDRVQKRKAEQKVRLTTAQKARLQTRCKASQGLISSLEGRIKGIETSRGQVHKNIVTHLTNLSEKLKNRGVNTDALNTNITELQTKIDTFNTDLAAYKVAVSDLADPDLNCQADPDGFKASLEAARAALQKTKEDSQAVKAFVKDTIKPQLQTIRAELNAQKPENNTDTTEGSQ